MKQQTEVHAEPNKQELLITRAFNLPLELLFKAYVEPEIVAQWMGTKVVKLENVPHGSYRFETTDPMGNVHGFNGTIHEFEPLQKITRTFKMENSPFDVQLEFLEFEATSATTSYLKMHIIFRSVALRDLLMQMPFAEGLNMAHTRLEKVVKRMLP